MLTTPIINDIIVSVVSECAGTGRQARLRGVCSWRTGSSPVTRTMLNVHNGLNRYEHSFFMHISV